MEKESTSISKTLLLSFEELVIKTKNDEIELVECIKNQYINTLKEGVINNKNSTTNKMIIATMCIKDLLKWIEEIGIVAIKNNKHLLYEINDLKSMQNHSASEQNQWEQFCNELEKNNTNLKNENIELSNNIKQIKQSYDTIIDQYQHFKTENETLLNKLESLKNKYHKIQNEVKQFEQQISNLNENNNYLKTQKDLIMKQHNITINKLKDQHKQEMIEMEAMITNSMKEREAPNQHYLTPISMLSELREFEAEQKYKDDDDDDDDNDDNDNDINTYKNKEETLIRIVSREQSEETLTTLIDDFETSVEWTSDTKDTDNKCDNIPLLYRIIKNQEQQLLTFRNELNNAKKSMLNGVESMIQKHLSQNNEINKNIKKLELKESEYQHQHYDIDYNKYIDYNEDKDDDKKQESEDESKEMGDYYLNEYKHKLYKLLIKYKLIDESNKSMNLKSSLDLIDNICQNRDKYNNAYFVANKKIDGLKEENQTLKQDLDALKISNQENKQNKCKKKKKRKNTEIKMGEIGEGNDIEDVDERDILWSLSDDLLCLMKYLQIVQNKNQYEYCIQKIEYLSLSLQDLANDIGSAILQNVVKILNVLITDIGDSNKYKFNNDGLHDIINKTKNKISDLYINKQTVPILRVKVNENEIYRESLSDIVCQQINDDNDCNECNECKPFKDEDDDDNDDNDNIPFVESIKIDGKWGFNKTARAIIYYKGKKYRRKLTDFEWLWKILFLNNDSCKSIPKLQSSLPYNSWYKGYLEKRQSELNTFLKHCHTTKWIRHFEGYNKIFFADTHKQWKRLRDQLDQTISLKMNNV